MPRSSSRLILTVSLTTLVFSLASFSAVQQQSQKSSQSGAAAAKKTSAVPAGKEGPKLSDEQKLAVQLLDTSEAASRGFEAPMRSYSLLQVASSFVTLDQPKARGLFRDAFTASLGIQDDPGIKTQLQQEILRALLALSQEDVEELLPQAEMSVRKPVSEIIVGRYAEHKQFDKAMELINQLNSVSEFPYAGAAKVIDAMSPEMIAEKQALFSQALTSYKNHEHPGVTVGEGTFTNLVVRVGASMPPKLALMAVDEILGQSKAAADRNDDISIAGPGGVASFANAYQFQLFAVLPLLRKLDEDRAKKMLEENQDLQAKLNQYPDGINSLMPPPKPGAATRTMASVRTADGPGQGPGAGAGPRPGGPAPGNATQDYMRREAMRKLQEIADEGEKDPTQAIAHSMTLPVKMDDRGAVLASPRASALESIARANVKKNPTGATQALSELRKITADLPLRSQAQYLSSAAALYLQMEEKDSAEKVVSEGFKVADKLLEIDTNADDPNTALKAWWPSTDAYRRFVEVESKISPRATMGVLREIKDPEIRTTESIMVARSLLGLPMKRFTVAEKKKDNNSVSTSESN
jgi:hypothetical protein